MYFHKSNRGKEECVERRSKEGGLGGTGLGVGFVLDFSFHFFLHTLGILKIKRIIFPDRRISG